MNSAANVALVVRFVDAMFNHGDYTVVDELLTEDFLAYSPTAPGDAAAQRRFVEVYRKAIPDFRLTFEDAFSHEDKVVLRWSGSGTHTVRVGALMPSGEFGTVEGISIYCIRDSRIWRCWHAYMSPSLLHNHSLSELLR